LNGDPLAFAVGGGLGNLPDITGRADALASGALEATTASEEVVTDVTGAPVVWVSTVRAAGEAAGATARALSTS
jgi:hypothetical protein